MDLFTMDLDLDPDLRQKSAGERPDVDRVAPGPFPGVPDAC
jgi:hypothetical protein